MLKFYSLLALLFIAHLANAQNVYRMTPVDSEFTMEVVRNKTQVEISLVFSDSLNFESIAIERKADFDHSFSQCKYITYDEVTKGGRSLKKIDRYPLPAAVDVYYRLKLVADGSMRTFPSIKLPGVK